MKKFIAALLAVLVAATSAAAYPPPPPPRRYGPPPPPPPPHHHRHPHDYCDDAAIFGGLAVGLMIGALASSQQDQAAAREAEQQRVFERETAEVRETARKLAEAQSVNVTEIISKLGPDHALEDLDNYWQAHGQPTLQDVNRPPRTLKIAGFSQNMRLLYDIDRERSTVTVTVSAPEYNVSESRTMPYVYTPPVARPSGGGVEKLLGFTVSDDSRSPEGFLVVTSVVPSTVAAYAGVKSGSVLCAVDGNSTANVSAAQMEAYVGGRAAAGAAVKLTLADGGARRTLELRP